MIRRFVKDPDDTLDYLWPFGTWLSEGDEIDSYTVEKTGTATVDSHSRVGSDITVWVSGGLVNTHTIVTVQITTTGGREVSRSARITVGQL